MMRIYNCHMHIFTINHVPVKFLPFSLVRFLARRRFTRGLARVLHNLYPFANDDLFDRYATFAQIGNLGSQRDIFNNIRRFYPADTKFVALSMDMEFMGCGHVKESFLQQLDELSALKQELGKVLLPFICVDPRRPNLLELVKEHIENRGFHGIKLYPPLGYFPYDSRLENLWHYVRERNLPVIAHTSRGGVYYQGKITDDMFRESRIGGIRAGSRSNRELCNYFSHPRNYEFLLQDFPGLKVSLGHFGGDTEWGIYLNDPPVPAPNDNWLNIIMDLLKRYPSLYADISYTLYNDHFTNYLKVLLQDSVFKNKILFGSDYYLVEQDTSEKCFSIDLRASLGEQDYQQVAETNPKKFLFS